MAFSVTSGMCFMNAETVSTTGVLCFNADPLAAASSSQRASRKWTVQVAAASAKKLLIQLFPIHDLTAASAMTSANSVMMASGAELSFVAPYDTGPITKIQVRGAAGVATFTATKTG